VSYLNDTIRWNVSKVVVLFLGVWEKFNNPDFNSPEFEGIENKKLT